MNPRNPQFNIRQARFPEDVATVRQIFCDYQDHIGIDLCFQSFEQELASLPGNYQCVLIADGGCVALRPYNPDTVELKRLFVYPAARGKGLGRLLMDEAIAQASKLGYKKIHLDTLKTKMPSAVRMYEALGFVEVPAGGGTKVPDLIDMELTLTLTSPQESDTEKSSSAQ